MVAAATRQHPNAVSVRATLSHVRMNDGSPNAVIEAALREVLRLDPANAQARRNLEVCDNQGGGSTA